MSETHPHVGAEFQQMNCDGWGLCLQRYSRHTTPMHLLESNVNLNMTRSLLGDASIETTNGYVEIDLEMKRKTLQSCEKLFPKKRKAGTVVAARQRHPVIVFEPKIYVQR